MTTENEETKIVYDAWRMLVLMKMLDGEIEKGNLMGIRSLSNKALDCMIHIEIDNGLSGCE